MGSLCVGVYKPTGETQALNHKQEVCYLQSPYLESRSSVSLLLSDGAYFV